MKYRELGNTGLKVSEIETGGVCETRCPFGVDVRANMRRAKEVFGY